MGAAARISAAQASGPFGWQTARHPFPFYSTLLRSNTFKKILHSKLLKLNKKPQFTQFLEKIRGFMTLFPAKRYFSGKENTISSALSGILHGFLPGFKRTFPTLFYF